MFRSVALALAFVSTLTGCVAAPPKGPLVEYRDGVRAVTRRVKCEANYELVTEDATSVSGQIAEHHILKGECVGFRREPDGTVMAIAPGYSLPLPPGSYAWEVVRSLVPSWRERLWSETRGRALEAERATGATIVVVSIVVIVVGGVVLLLWLKARSGGNDS